MQQDIVDERQNMKTETESKPKTSSLVRILLATEQDFEWYPTTDAMLASIVKYIRKHKRSHRNIESMLDIGAGDGRVLKYFRDSDINGTDRYDKLRQLYAIEKSMPLIHVLASVAQIIGTDFREQSLLEKKVELIFCNPPYSEYEAWATKIIREANSKMIVLIIPTRWKKSEQIDAALKDRKMTAKIIDTVSFHNAERHARATADILYIELDDETPDAFDLHFKEFFPELDKIDEGEDQGQRAMEQDTKEKVTALVAGTDYVDRIVSLYQQELAQLHENYQAIRKINSSILREMNVTVTALKAAIQKRLSELKSIFWSEIFHRMDAITSRLTNEKRNSLLRELREHAEIDFTAGNILAIVIWVIHHANDYIDSQLIAVYEKMASKANVVLYKSNQRAWIEDRWRYQAEGTDPNSHYGLEYRMVLHSVGGYCGGSSWRHDSTNALDQSAFEFMQDLVVIARNLGFKFPGDETMPYQLRRGEHTWRRGAREEIHHAGGILFSARAYLNNNVHLHLGTEFAKALNVEFGRLKGWLKTPQEAAMELGYRDAAMFFEANKKLMPSDSPFQLCETNPQSKE